MASILKTSRKDLMIMILAGLLLLFAIVMTVLQFNNLRELRAAVKEEEMAVMEARAVLTRRLEYRANAPEYEERIRILELMMPDTPQEEQILRYFEYIAEEHDLRVQQINFGGRVINEEQGFVRMPLSITLEGRFINMVDLFAHLYHGERAVRVDNISISLAPTPDLPANTRVSISANAFHSINEQ